MLNAPWSIQVPNDHIFKDLEGKRFSEIHVHPRPDKSDYAMKIVLGSI